MLDKCLEYAKLYNIKFNGTKSQYMIFYGRGNSEIKWCINLNGVTFENTKSALYLGNNIETNEKR